MKSSRGLDEAFARVGGVDYNGSDDGDDGDDQEGQTKDQLASNRG